ncbi:MAG: EamA family transporter [Candidatus Lokiarchaeota archaeon]|nr:EamA family transporter [Candidatus Lokiarchaeota archaeon]
MSRVATYLKLALAANLWGTTFALSKILLATINVFALITLRMLFALAALLVYLAATRKIGRVVPMFKANARWMLVIGVAFFALSYIMQYSALSPWIPGESSTFNQAVLLNLQAFFVVAINRFYFKKRASRYVILGAMVAFTGAVLINFKPDGFSLAETIWSDLMTIGCVVLWGCFTAFSKPITEKEGSDPIVFNTIIIIIASIVLLPFGALVPGGLANVHSFGIGEWLAVAWLGAACVGVTYVLWFSGLKEIDSSRVVVFVYMEPIFAGILTFLIPSLGEQLSWFSAIGMVLCFLGVTLAQREPRRKGIEAARPTIAIGGGAAA